MRKLAFLLLFVVLLAGCGASRSPVERIVASLAGAPEYMVILEDMRQEGAFIKTYYHRYKLAQGERVRLTQWMKVPKEFYRANANFLGMTLAAKTKDGKPSTTPGPPGYQYVGNSQYGQWRTGARGGSFWEFYGKYRLMTDLIGLGRGPIYRRDWNGYNRFRSAGRPYYGAGNRFGTGGSVTRQTKPNFFRRRVARQQASRQRFGKKFGQRFGRTRSRARFGGGGFGK